MRRAPAGIGQGRAAAGHRALEALDDVPGERERPLLEPLAASESLPALELEREGVSKACSAEQDLRLHRGRGLRGGSLGIGLPVVEEGQGDAHPHHEALVLVAGDDELVEDVPEPERGIRNPASLGERQARAGGDLLRLERAEVGALVEVERGKAGREAAGEEATCRLDGPEGMAGDADGLCAEQQRGGELLLLLAEVGGVLLGLEDGAVRIQPGDVSALLPLELEDRRGAGRPGPSRRGRRRGISAVATSEMPCSRSNQRWRSVSRASSIAASRAERVASWRGPRFQSPPPG